MTALSVQVVIATAGLALVAAAIYGIYKVLKASVTAADSFKKSMIDLKVLAGGQFTAQSMFGEIREFARNSPYSVDQLGKLSAQMMSFGVSAERTVTNLKMLGEIAGGDAEKLGFLAKAMNDVTAMGRLQGQELRQFANQGFNPLMQMMKETGKSYQELRQEMSNGLISSEDVRKAIESATSEGGLFYGRIEEGQKTISAQVTKFGGMIKELLAQVGSMSGIWEAVYYSVVALNKVLETTLWLMDKITAAKQFLIDSFIIGNKEARESLELEEAMQRALQQTIQDMESEIAAEEKARNEQLKELQELQDQVHENQLTNLYGERQAEKEMYSIALQRRVLAEEITQETANKLQALQEQVWAQEDLKKAEEEKKKLQEEAYKDFERQMEMIKKEREEKLKAQDEHIKAIERTEEAKRKAAQKSHDEAIKLIDEEAKKQMELFGNSNKAAMSFEAGSTEEYKMIRDRELARREEERKKQVDITAQASRDAANAHLANIDKAITKSTNAAKQSVAEDIMEIQ
jgi:tape measure domain-containing protein